MPKYYVVLEERIETVAYIEAENSRHAYEKAKKGEYELDTLSSSPLPNKVKKVRRVE